MSSEKQAPIPASLLSGHEAQEQVILPAKIAFRICMRGIRTRLGRSVVTLFGVALGIAFLMSVLSSYHIKQALAADAEQARAVDRMVSVFRAEVGMLKAKPLLVVLGAPSKLDLDFIKRLVNEEADVRVLTESMLPKGTRAASIPNDRDQAAAVVLLGSYEMLLGRVKPLPAERKTVMYEDRGDAMARLGESGVAVKRLGIELRPDEMTRIARREVESRYRMYWIVAVSLLITVGGITNAMLMSVTERFREIGTMKCLGALSTFVVKLFLIESSLVGLVGSVVGALGGLLFSLAAYSYTFEVGRVFASVNGMILSTQGLMCIGVGVVLAVVAGIYPARVASKMIPAVALSTNV